MLKKEAIKLTVDTQPISPTAEVMTQSIIQKPEIIILSMRTASLSKESVELDRFRHLRRVKRPRCPHGKRLDVTCDQCKTADTGFTSFFQVSLGTNQKEDREAA